MSTETGTVWVVDDDEAMRDSLRMLLTAAGLEAETFRSAHSFLAVWRPEMRGCILLDIRMPDMSGLDLQLELQRRQCRLPIIFITGHGDVEMAVQAMQRGAANFLQKPFNDEALLDAVNDSLAESADTLVVSHQREVLRQRYATLTPREREVMGRVVAGDSNKVIAIDLDLSPRTVEIHRARVMEKMEASSLAKLVSFALELRDSDVQ